MSTVAEKQADQFINSCQCADCVEVRGRAIYIASRGDELHSSGTVIHWDWRAPDSPKTFILITCHECKHDSFVRRGVIERIYKEKRCWKGLCSNCSQNFPAHRKYKGKYQTPSGAVIDFDKGPHDRNKYWVYCPNFSTCEGLEQRRVDKYNINVQQFYCGKCLSKTRSSSLRQAWHLQKNGVTEKRARGRQPGDTILDHAAFASNVKACVIEEWRSVGRAVSSVEQVAVLTRYHNKYRGDRIAESTLRDRLKKAGFKMKWSAFVELTVREVTAT